MGQKTEFNLDDWTFPEEESQEQAQDQMESEHFTGSESDDDFSAYDAKADFPDLFETDLTSLDADKTVYEIKDNQLVLSRSPANKKTSDEPLSQEEEAFRKQLEDLFELLELEKSADKSHGVRVYQTDSSPSRPWRFH